MSASRRRFSRLSFPVWQPDGRPAAPPCAHERQRPDPSNTRRGRRCPTRSIGRKPRPTGCRAPRTKTRAQAPFEEPSGFASTPRARGLHRGLCRALGTPDDIAADVATSSSRPTGEASRPTAPRGCRATSLWWMPGSWTLPRARHRCRPRRFRPVRCRERLGHHAGRIAIDWAIERADDRDRPCFRPNANHYGIAGWYALRAADGRHDRNVDDQHVGFVAPTRRARTHRTNPIAIAAPAGHRPAFSLDMATSTVPRGKLEVAERRGTPIPLGWAIDRDGSRRRFRRPRWTAPPPPRRARGYRRYKGYGWPPR